MRTIEPRFREDWFSQASCDVLAGLVAEVATVDGMLLEIGAWEGRSTIAMATAAEPRIVHTVDTWQGSPGEVSALFATKRDVRAQFDVNVAAFTSGNVASHQMGWREFLSACAGLFALVFIDGEHSYREVHDAIVAVRSKLSAGAIVCGDDRHHPPVRQAVNDAIGEMRVTCVESLWIWRT